MHHDANHAEGGDVIDEQDGAFGSTTSGSAVVISVLVIGCSSREVSCDLRLFPRILWIGLVTSPPPEDHHQS